MNAKRVLSQQWLEKSLKVIKSKWKLADVTTTTKKFADLIIMLKTFAISMAFTRKSKCTNMKVDKQMWICETRKLPEKKARRRWRKRKKTKNAQLWASYKYALKDEILPSWFEAFSNSSASHRASHFPLKKHPCHFTLYLSPSLVYARQSDSGIVLQYWRSSSRVDEKIYWLIPISVYTVS